MDEIQDRHRELAKQYHPDLHTADERDEAHARMSEVNAAYTELQRMIRRVEGMGAPAG